MTGMRGHGSSCSNYSGMSVPRDYRAPGSISPCISCICHSARLITKTYYFLSWGYMDERSIIKTIKKGCTRCNIDSGESMNNFSLEWCREGETSWGYVWTRSWGIVQSFHSGIAARRMGMGKGKKVWNNTGVQGFANNFRVLGSENNGNRIMAGEDHAWRPTTNKWRSWVKSRQVLLGNWTGVENKDRRNLFPPHTFN